MTLRLRHLLHVLLFVSSGSAMFGATLTARIYSDQGPPVSNIPVIVQPIVAASTGLVTYPAITDVQGKFTVTVPSGAGYSVCAGSPTLGLLNSCEWSPAQSVVQVPAGAAAAQAVLTLATGTTLYFRVGDSAGLLSRPGVPPKTQGATATAGDASPPPAILFGLWDSTGHYHSVPLTSGDDQGVNFEILVPLNSNFTLAVQGTNVQVTDQTGASVLGSPRTISSSPASASQTQFFQATSGASTGPVATPTSTEAIK